MGYNSRFTIHAINPHTMAEVEWSSLPAGYRAGIDHELSTAAGWGVHINKDGLLFGGDSAKFYEYDDAFRTMSKEKPEAIWVVHIEGEEHDDTRALYAYRGVTYEEKMPPWTPPPPNMNRLPSVDDGFWLPDHDPPSLKEGLQIALQHLQHSSSCRANLPGLTFIDQSKCDCHVKKVAEALHQQAISDGVAPR